MRYLLPIYFLLMSFGLLAQTTSDSLLRQTTLGNHLLNEQDTLTQQLQYAQKQLDSLRSLPRSTVDSSQAIRYIKRQQDSLNQQITRWHAKKDSLLSPLDTLQQKVDNAKQRVRTFRDTVAQKIPVSQATEALPSIPDQPSAQVPALPTLSVRKLTSQLPDLPAPVHAVRERIGIWQQKLSAQTGKISAFQSKVTPYTSSLEAGTEALEQQALQHIPEQGLLQQNHQALQDWQGQQQQAFDQEQQRAQLQQRLMTSAQDHFAHHSESLSQAQEQLSDRKRKYSMVQGEEKQKRTSLSGKPLTERLVYGGTLQVLKGPPLAVDLSPQLGYQFDKRFTAGVGATYRLSFADQWVGLRRSVVTDNAVYGGRAYLQFDVIKGFLLHGEYERLSQAVPQDNQDVPTRGWQTSALAGIGKTYRIAGKWEGQVLLLYNFRHQQQSVHTRPWVFRFGFQRTSAQ